MPSTQAPSTGAKRRYQSPKGICSRNTTATLQGSLLQPTHHLVTFRGLEGTPATQHLRAPRPGPCVLSPIPTPCYSRETDRTLRLSPHPEHHQQPTAPSPGTQRLTESSSGDPKSPGHTLHAHHWAEDPTGRLVSPHSAECMKVPTKLSCPLGGRRWPGKDGACLRAWGCSVG